MPEVRQLVTDQPFLPFAAGLAVAADSAADAGNL